MSEHTPGPWSGPTSPHDSVPWFHAYGPDGKHVFHTDRPEAELMANMRLIAAAPEMLEALREIATLAARITRRADARRIGCEAGRMIRMVEGRS